MRLERQALKIIVALCNVAWQNNGMPLNDWDIAIRSQRNDLLRTTDIVIAVCVADELMCDVAGDQHAIVDHIARRLHEYLDKEFAEKRLGTSPKELKR
jgi:hypothetical protein